MTPTWLAAVDRFWAQELGCESQCLHPSSTYVQEHAGAYVGYQGVFVLVTDASPLVSVPPDLPEVVRGRLAQLTTGTVRDVPALCELFEGSSVDRIVGPAFIGYTDTLPKRNVHTDARVLRDSDEAAFHALRDECIEEDWQHGAPPWAPGDVVGAFSEAGKLSAVAGFKIWGETIAHIYVVVHPNHRERGYGLRAVEAAARLALNRGLIAQLRTLESNLGAMRIARTLGFQQHGFSVAVRLAADE